MYLSCLDLIKAYNNIYSNVSFVHLFSTTIKQLLFISCGILIVELPPSQKLGVDTVRNTTQPKKVLAGYQGRWFLVCNLILMQYMKYIANGVLSRPVQSFETQYLNTSYFTFRSLFGQKFGLKNHLGDIKVFDLIWYLILLKF